MSSNVITLFGNPSKLEKWAIRNVVKLLKDVLRRQPVEKEDDMDNSDTSEEEDPDEFRLSPLAAKENISSTSSEVRDWLDNNISSNALWEEVQAGDEMAEEVLSLIFHSCLTSLELTCLDRDDWAPHLPGSLNAALILKEIRKSADSGTQMMTKRFHLQGYEYKGPYTGQVFQHLMSVQANIFPPLVWQRLTDLSLLHFDWTSIHLPDFSQGEEDSRSDLADYYSTVIRFYQSIGQNLPSLTRLEVTQPYNIQDDVYFWMFLRSPPSAFPEIPADIWATGVLENHRWISKIREPPGETGHACHHHPQLSLETVLNRNAERNPICYRLEQLELHSSTERMLVVAAILTWCPRLLTVNLPEFDLLSETLDSAVPLHYTNNFLLPCLSLQHKPSGTNIRKLKVEDPESELTRELWRHFGLTLCRAEPLSELLETVVRRAPLVQDLTLGNNGQHGLGVMLDLEQHHLSQLEMLRELSVLQLESINADTVETLLAAIGFRLRRLTLININVDLGVILGLLPQAEMVELRNTRVVLSDEEDDSRELPWSPLTSSLCSLRELVIGYTVSLDLLYFCLTRLPSLTLLSLGHGRHRYSQRSSVRLLTPERWESLLEISHLPSLQHLVIPVLFQPDRHSPQSTVSILDYEDVLNVFRRFPKLQTAVLHRREYQRSGDQSNFPFVMRDSRMLSEYPYRNIGYINVMDF